MVVENNADDAAAAATTHILHPIIGWTTIVFNNYSKEKWESSGASRAVSDVYAQVPQGTKDYFTSTSQQLFNRQHLRAFSVVFGIGEERPFYVEKSPALLMERIRHNGSFFYMNYMVLTAILFTLTLLVSPSAILGIGGLGFAWMYMIRSSTNGHIRIGCKYFRNITLVELLDLLKTDIFGCI